MKLSDEDLKIYSEEVRDILSEPPQSIFQWGNTILFVFIIILITISYYVKYPDIISSQVMITTKTPPEKVVAKTSGKIEAILIENKKYVQINTPLAVIESSANYKDIFKLDYYLTKSQNIQDFPFFIFQSSQLGEVEAPFALFQKEYMAYKFNNDLRPFQVETNAQSYEAIRLRERLFLLESQKEISEGEQQLQKNDFKRYEGLYSKGIISAQEFEKQNLIYLQSQKNHKVLLGSISQIKSTLNDLKLNSNNTKINEQKENKNLNRNLYQSLFQLKKSIKDWELLYILRSSINGQVTFYQVWNDNQTVSIGDNIFGIIPINQKEYIAKVRASSQNSGKIKAGQDVIIRLSNYPDREFGTIKGKIQSISLTPDREGNLIIDVTLPKGLVTSYNKKINFQQEMIGSADIITNDQRLIERILYQFRDIFKR